MANPSTVGTYHNITVSYICTIRCMSRGSEVSNINTGMALHGAFGSAGASWDDGDGLYVVSTEYRYA